MKGNFIYGPCRSRRLGISLGVDLIPHKTCSLDCLYCECGQTTLLTQERREYLPTTKIMSALSRILQYEPALDYITFAGSGEPTLHQEIGQIIRFLKENYPGYPVAVITNATLLQDPQVIDDIRQADLIIPSLDAVSQTVFEKINRPVAGLTSAGIIQGIKALRQSFSGRLWLEIFIIPGLNDTDDELDLFRQVLSTIAFDKVQLNKLDRPGAVDWIKTASPQRLQQIAAYLGQGEIIAAAN